MRYRRKEASQSLSWTMRFGSAWPHVLSADAFPFLGAALAAPALTSPMFTVWRDLASEPVEIRAAAVRNRYEILTLLWVPSRERFKRRRVLQTVGSVT
jgi:hypothetical protein